MVGTQDSMDAVYCVYFLRDPDTFESRYVGITKNGSARKCRHQTFDNSSGTHCLAWKLSLRKQGKKPLFDVVISGLTKSAALAVEQRLVFVHGFMRPGKLLNVPVKIKNETITVTRLAYQNRKDARQVHEQYLQDMKAYRGEA